MALQCTELNPNLRRSMLPRSSVMFLPKGICPMDGIPFVFWLWIPVGRWNYCIFVAKLICLTNKDGECTVEIRLERNTTSAIGSVNKTVHEASTINPQMKNLLSNHGDKDRRRQFSPRSEGKRRLSRKLHNRRDPQVQADDLALVLSEDQPLGMLNEVLVFISLFLFEVIKYLEDFSSPQWTHPSVEWWWPS